MPTTTLNIISAHKQIISLLLQIEQAQINITEAEPYLDESRKGLSYYAAVAPHYKQIINANTNRRDELIEQYRALNWQAFKMELPRYGNHECTIPF